MINVKSISNLDELSTALNGNSQKLSANDNEKLGLNGDNELANVADTSDLSEYNYINADFIKALKSLEALIEVSIKTSTSTGQRKSCQFPFGEFMHLIALNLAYLNGNILGNYVTRELADKIYVKTGLDGTGKLINNEAIGFQNVYNRLIFQKAIKSDTGELSNLNPDSVDITGNDKWITINGPAQINDLYTNNISVETNISTLNLDASNLTADNITNENLSVNTHLSIGSNYGFNSEGIISCKSLNTTSVDTDDLTCANVNSNITFKLQTTIDTDGSLNMEGELKIKAGGAIGFYGHGETTANSTISSDDGKVAISKLKVGNFAAADQWDDYQLQVEGINVKNIKINDNVTAQSFTVDRAEVRVLSSGFYAPDLTSDIIAKKACWA